MRTALAALMFILSLLTMGQTIRINSAPPAYGTDSLGRRYFVLLAEQERKALSDLVRLSYCDSLVHLQDELLDASSREVSLLMDRLQLKDETIEKKSKLIAQWELAFIESQEQRNASEKNVASLRSHIRRKRWGWWSAIVVGAAGVGIGVSK